MEFGNGGFLLGLNLCLDLAGKEEYGGGDDAETDVVITAIFLFLDLKV